MYTSPQARELAILMRISRDLDLCGDLTATVDSPAELIAWSRVLSAPAVNAWQSKDSGSRFVEVSADHRRAPVRGHISAVLSCEQHPDFWDALHLEDLEAGRARSLTVGDLDEAWQAMPIQPPDDRGTTDPPHPEGRVA
jgi:hypothetical protein